MKLTRADRLAPRRQKQDLLLAKVAGQLCHDLLNQLSVPKLLLVPNINKQHCALVATALDRTASSIQLCQMLFYALHGRASCSSADFRRMVKPYTLCQITGGKRGAALLDNTWLLLVCLLFLAAAPRLAKKITITNEEEEGGKKRVTLVGAVSSSLAKAIAVTANDNSSYLSLLVQRLSLLQGSIKVAADLGSLTLSYLPSD